MKTFFLIVTIGMLYISYNIGHFGGVTDGMKQILESGACRV